MMHSPARIVVVGASAGGVESLREVIAGIPADFAGAVFVVVHIPPHQPSSLPQILNRCGKLRAEHPHDGDKIQPGVAAAGLRGFSQL